MSPKRIRPSKLRKRSRKARVAKIRCQKKNVVAERISPQPSTSARKRLDFGIKKYVETAFRTSDSSSSTSDLINLEQVWESKSKNKNLSESNQKINVSTSPEISFISENDLESIEKHELIIEKEAKTSTSNFFAGNRIVEIEYYTQQVINIQYQHNTVCTFGKLCPVEEDRRGSGLVSTIIMRCSQCLREYSVQTENPAKVQSVINTGAVWGTLAVGSTYAHLEEMHSIMDIPPMSRYKFKEIETKLGDIWKDSLWETMKNAGEEEKNIAIENGNVDTDNIPKITDYLDGGWSKRSYGHNYNAASGVGVIIGKETGKVLWVGVRNKYCTVCARAANKKENIPDHTCFRNWSGSSSAMEADIIVEGFSRSEEMHGVRYMTFIADGDSSVYVQIKRRVLYGQRVEKIECLNHVVKNYGKSLHAVKTDKSVPPAGRKLITSTLRL